MRKSSFYFSAPPLSASALSFRLLWLQSDWLTKRYHFVYRTIGQFNVLQTPGLKNQASTQARRQDSVTGGGEINFWGVRQVYFV